MTKQSPGVPVSLPQAAAMKAAPPSWRLATMRMRSGHVVERVEHREIAFARHSERGGNPLREQAIDQHLRPGSLEHPQPSSGDGITFPRPRKGPSAGPRPFAIAAQLARFRVTSSMLR